jgi:hypothetical protein
MPAEVDGKRIEYYRDREKFKTAETDYFTSSPEEHAKKSLPKFTPWGKETVAPIGPLSLAGLWVRTVKIIEFWKQMNIKVWFLLKLRMGLLIFGRKEIFLGTVNGVNWKSRNFTITSQKMAVPVTFFPLRM